MPASFRLPYAISILGIIGVVVGVLGRFIGSDPLISLGIAGGLTMLAAGLMLRRDYRGAASDYGAWVRSRGRVAGEGAGRGLGTAISFLGTVFALTSVLWLVV